MKLAILLLPALLAGSGSAAARPRPSIYDCTQQRSVMEPVQQGFEATENSATWAAFPGNAVQLTVGAYPRTDEGRHAVMAGRMFDAAAATYFSVSIRDRSTAAVTVDILAGDRLLALLPIVRGSYGVIAAHVPTTQMASLLGESGDLRIVFRDRQGRFVTQAALPITVIQSALSELPTMFAQVQENANDRPHRCAQVIEWSE